MLDSGLEGAIFAGLTALLGLAQAFLSQSQRRLKARLLNLTTGYFIGHFLVAIAFFCVWKIPSSLTWRHVAFQVLMENAWIEGLGITLYSCLKITAEVRALYNIFRSIAAMTFMLHILGFLLLAIGWDNGRPTLFGAALLVPAALLVSFIYIRTSKFDASSRLHILWIHSLFSIVCLIILTGFRKDDTFLQANVILISVTSLVLVCLPFFRVSRVSECLDLPSPRLERTKGSLGMGKHHERNVTHSCDGASISTSLESETRRQLREHGSFASKPFQDTSASDSYTPPLSPLLPPAPILHMPPRPNENLGMVDNAVENTVLEYASGNSTDNRIYITTDVETFSSVRQNDEQMESSSWVVADGSGR